MSRLAKWVDEGGRFTQLPEVYELAIEASLAVVGPSHPLLGCLRVHFARFLFTQLSPAPIQRYPAGDPRNPRVSGSHRLGRATDAPAPNGRRSRALREATLGEEILRDAIRLDLRHLTDDDARRLALGRESALDLILTLAATGASSGEIAQAWDAYLRSRALVLDELASRQQAVATHGDTALARLALALDSARSRIAQLFFAPERAGAGPAQDIARAREDVARLEVALARRSDSFRRRMHERTAGLADVLAHIGPEEALIAFAYYHDLTPGPGTNNATTGISTGDSLQVLAFVLAPGSRAPRVLPLGSARSLDALADRWRLLVSQGTALRHDAAIDRAANAAGDSLRRRAWDPIAPFVHGARRVYVVMDGALQLVNLAALPTGGTSGSYVIEHAPAFAYLGTERDLARGPRAPTGRGLLAMGAADFGGPSDPAPERGTQAAPGSGCDGLRRLRFRSLPETEYEIQSVAEHWRGSWAGDSLQRGDCLSLTGANASELAFRSSSHGRSALHVATHGFFLRDTCATSWRPPGVSPRASQLIVPPQGADSPLLASGIALAGANNRATNEVPENDGILTAEEIASLDLSSARWVVLSACETALGETETHEGVLGLRRAFVIAGAGTVVSSLWQVDDRATMEFMNQLYDRRFSRGEAVPEAMRDAGLWLLRRKRASGFSTLPADWGAFLAVD